MKRIAFILKYGSYISMVLAEASAPLHTEATGGDNVLHERETVADASMIPAKERQHVTPDSGNGTDGIGKVVPPFRPADMNEFLDLMKPTEQCPYLNSRASSPHIAFEVFKGRI